MAEPAEEDVERMAEWAHLPGVTNVTEDRQVALNLLRRGVTLPPEPDTPPEPQERYDEAEYTQERVDKLLAEVERLRDKAPPGAER